MSNPTAERVVGAICDPPCAFYEAKSCMCAHLEAGGYVKHFGPPDKDQMCIRCRRPRSEHEKTLEGLRCRTVQFFSPCPHTRRTGFGMVACDGSSSGSSTCDDCGEVFKW